MKVLFQPWAFSKAYRFQRFFQTKAPIRAFLDIFSILMCVFSQYIFTLTVKLLKKVNKKQFSLIFSLTSPSSLKFHIYYFSSRFLFHFQTQNFPHFHMLVSFRFFFFLQLLLTGHQTLLLITKKFVILPWKRKFAYLYTINLKFPVVDNMKNCFDIADCN